MTQEPTVILPQCERRVYVGKTPEEWQIAVNGALGLRTIADCKMYGLLEGGPKINVLRCDDIIKRGIEQGIQPSASAVDLALGMIAQLNAENS